MTAWVAFEGLTGLRNEGERPVPIRFLEVEGGRGTGGFPLLWYVLWYVNKWTR